MLLFIFLVLGAWNASSFGDVICEGDPFEACPRPKLFSAVPESKTEYDALCPYLKDYVLCLGRIEMNCTTKFFATPDEYNSVLSAFSEFCEEGSVLNLVVTENLKCLNESLGDYPCRRHANAAVYGFEKWTSFMTELELEPPPYIGSLCIKESFLTACIADKISKNCGSLVKDVALVMVHWSYLIQEACSVEDVLRILDNGPLLSLSSPSNQKILEDVLKQMY